MAENEPAEASYINCGWTEVHIEGYYGYYSQYFDGSAAYSEYCDAGIDAACTATAGGIMSLLFLLAAMVFCICAVIWVNPFCEVKMKCGDCYRRLFIVTLVLIIIGIIAFFALCSGFCLSSENLDLGVGTSMVLSIVATILVAIAVGILYSP